jgi:hypothetical protein
MRKKIPFMLFVAVALSILCVQMTPAYQITVLDNIYRNVPIRGGEFSIETSPNGIPGGLGWVLPFYGPDSKGIATPTSFQSFCLEMGEGLNFNTKYDAVLNNNAVTGGVGPGGDPISIGTARLYFEFSQGSLPNYDFSNGAGQRVADAGLLQQTFWWLEGEAADPGGKFHSYLNTFYTDAVMKGDNYNNGQRAFPVMALNLSLTQPDGTVLRKQDVLVTTPIPGAIWLLGSGLIGLVAVRRRRK